jgi:glycosyltransferase involved in cell wall biosynthesis
MNSKKKISVIIRTKNEERWIGHCIQSVLEFTNKPEIIIVDNKSKDETISIVKSFKEDPSLKDIKSDRYTKIKILNINDYSPGKSLNLGVKSASSPIILIISAHCVLRKINLTKHIKDLKKYRCIFGNQVPVWKGKKITKRYIWSHFKDKQIENMYSEQEQRYFMHNALSIFERSFVLKNKFDENLTTKEDRYWVNSIVKKRQKFLYDPELEADHYYTEAGNTWKGIG